MFTCKQKFYYSKAVPQSPNTKKDLDNPYNIYCRMIKLVCIYSIASKFIIRLQFINLGCIQLNYKIL